MHFIIEFESNTSFIAENNIHTKFQWNLAIKGIYLYLYSNYNLKSCVCCKWWKINTIIQFYLVNDLGIETCSEFIFMHSLIQFSFSHLNRFMIWRRWRLFAATNVENDITRRRLAGFFSTLTKQTKNITSLWIDLLTNIIYIYSMI